MAETIGRPTFEVREYPAEELETWAALFSIRNSKNKNPDAEEEPESTGSNLTPENITPDDSAVLLQAFLQQHGGRMM